MIDSTLPFCAALLILGLMVNILTTAYYLYYGLETLSFEADYNITVIAYAVCGAAFFYWFLKMKRPVPAEEIKKISHLKDIGMLILAGIGCQFLASGLISILSRIFTKTISEYGNMMASNYAGNPVTVAVYIVLLAPVTEELIFRGVTIMKAGNTLPFARVNLLQATLFAIYHFDPVQSVYAFLLGLLLGYIHKKYGTLLAPVLLHMVINAASYLIMALPKSEALVITITLLGGAALTISLFYLFRKEKSFS